MGTLIKGPIQDFFGTMGKFEYYIVGVGKPWISSPNPGYGYTTTGSEDGITWVNQQRPLYNDSPMDKQWNSVEYSRGLRLFAATSSFSIDANNPYNMIMTSSNGKNWSGVTLTTHEDNNLWYDIVWSPELKMFAAIGRGLDSSSAWTKIGIVTSTDGITWTDRTFAGDGVQILFPTAICWSKSLSLFVGVGSVVGGPYGAHTGEMDIYRSSDGITWTAHNSGVTGTWLDVIWSPELSLFVAIGGGVIYNVMTSPDGITWTNRNISSSLSPNSICWSKTNNMFVAASQSNGTQNIMTSSNGITWTKRTTSDSTRDYQRVIWSESLSLFIAAAQKDLISGNYRNTAIMTSPNGTTWTNRTGPNEIVVNYMVSR